jgi:hypothetical protein
MYLKIEAGLVNSGTHYQVIFTQGKKFRNLSGLVHPFFVNCGKSYEEQCYLTKLFS